jgi:hypothetical protein
VAGVGGAKVMKMERSEPGSRRLDHSPNDGFKYGSADQLHTIPLILLAQLAELGGHHIRHTAENMAETLVINRAVARE